MKWIFLLSTLTLTSQSYAQNWSPPVSSIRDTSKIIGNFYIPQSVDKYTDKIYFSDKIYTVNPKNQQLIISCNIGGELTKEDIESNLAPAASTEQHYAVSIVLIDDFDQPKTDIPVTFKYRIDSHPAKQFDGRYYRFYNPKETSIDVYSTRKISFGNQFIKEAISSKKLIFNVYNQEINISGGEFDLSGLSEALKFSNMEDCNKR